MLSQLKEGYQKLPLMVKQLLKRVVLLITAWMLLYHLILQPCNIPDQWLSNVTARGTAKLISAWYHQPTEIADKANGTSIFMGNKKVLFIAYSCDALELYLIYAGFLFCIPTTVKRFFVFVAAGVLSIFILNVLRCFILTLLNFNQPEWFDFAHHYAFTLAVYAFIFFAWYQYIKNYIKPNAAS